MDHSVPTVLELQSLGFVAVGILLLVLYWLRCHRRRRRLNRVSFDLVRVSAKSG